MTLLLRLGAAEISTQWPFRYPLLVKMPISIATFFPRTISSRTPLPKTISARDISAQINFFTGTPRPSYKNALFVGYNGKQIVLCGSSNKQ